MPFHVAADGGGWDLLEEHVDAHLHEAIALDCGTEKGGRLRFQHSFADKGADGRAVDIQ